jgi:hypothetical protein
MVKHRGIQECRLVDVTQTASAESSVHWRALARHSFGSPGIETGSLAS